MNYFYAIHQLKILQWLFCTLAGHQATIQIKYDDISMKTRLISTRFTGTFGRFFNTSLGFTPNWDYKPTNAIHAHSPGFQICDKFLHSSTIVKLYLKRDCINGSINNGVQQPILYSFVSKKPSGFKTNCEAETIHYKNIKKSVLNTITLYFEYDNHEKIDFNGRTLTFTLHIFKNWTIYSAFKNLKINDITLVKNITLVQKTLLVR